MAPNTFPAMRRAIGVGKSAGGEGSPAHFGLADSWQKAECRQCAHHPPAPTPWSPPNQFASQCPLPCLLALERDPRPTGMILRCPRPQSIARFHSQSMMQDAVWNVRSARSEMTPFPIAVPMVSPTCGPSGPNPKKLVSWPRRRHGSAALNHAGVAVDFFLCFRPPGWLAFL